MNFIKRNGIILFVLVLLIHCICIYTEQGSGRIISKLLLVPVLMLYLFATVRGKKASPSLTPVFTALFFAFLGDLFLTQTGQLCFILGMVCFITTHVCNSIYFLKTQPLHIATARPALLAFSIFVVAVFFIFRLIRSSLGDLTGPILFYMAIIGIMGTLATNVITNKMAKQTAIRYFIPGAAIFILSDSILAMNMFYFHQPATWEIPVMATYGIAQCLLVLGFSKAADK